MKRNFLFFTTLLSVEMAFTIITVPAMSQTSRAPNIPSSWSIAATYTVPGKASGLAWDGTYIYFGEYWSSASDVYRFDPNTGNSTLICTGPFSAAYGLTYKSPNLVTISQPSNSSQPSSALEFTMSGTQVSTIALPDHYMSGIAYDNGDYWVCTYYPDPGKIYHINSSGTVLSQFIPPNTQSWDICLQGSDLWIADFYGNMIYKVTPTGTVLESHASQGTNPSGIVFDGTYLWYCDGPLTGNNTLYKIDLQGTGTPAITVPVNSHDYGTVTIGNSPSWICQVQNTGTADLVINGVTIPQGQPVYTTFAGPVTITPGNSINIPFIYTPVAAIPLSTQATIASSDPVHPTTTVTLTGTAVYPGAHLNITETSHDWNERRAGAYSRWFLSVTNDGDQPLELSALDFSDTHFTADAGISLPVTIGTLVTKDLGIWFHPTEGVSYSGTLSITSNDPSQNPFVVTLGGTGVEKLYPMGTLLWSYLINAGFDNSPKAIRPIADITGDGVDDVIIASEDDNIRCFNGNASVDGDVMWTTPIASGAVYQQNALAIISDIDYDGYKDVVAGTTGGSCSIIAYSGKTGLQIWSHDTHEYGNGGWVYQVDVSQDYNDDGFPDVLACAGDDGNGTGPRRAYCLNGKTGISLWETPCGGAVFSVIGVEDFTGDGTPDAIAGATTSDQSHGRVYGINGATGAILWTFPTAGSSVWALMQDNDINSDGVQDVVCGDFSGHFYILDATNGTSLYTFTIANDLILRFENLGDVNKDGFRDFITGHSSATAIVLSGKDLSTIWSKTMADKAWNVTNVGDVTYDGVNDAGVGTLYSDNYAYFMNGTNGVILHSTNNVDPVDALSAIPDIVGDHSKEMIVGGREGSVVCLSGGYDSTTIAVPHTNGVAGEIVRLYPNPCKSVLNISLDLQKSSDVSITITDVAGRIEFTKEIENVLSGNRVIRISRDQMGPGLRNAGLHLITVSTGEASYHFKVVFE
jgi:hypothetical protein